MYAKKIEKKYGQRFKSTGRYGVGRPLSPLYKKEEFGDFETPHEVAVATQRLNKDKLIKERFKQVKNLQLSYFEDFNSATQVIRNQASFDTSKPLYQRVLETEEAKVRVHSRKNVINRRKSTIVTSAKANKFKR